MSNLYGMDIDSVAQFESTARSNREKVDAVSKDVTSKVNILEWLGPDAEKFTLEWNSLHNKSLLAATSALTLIADTAKREREEQISASSAENQNFAPSTASASTVGTAQPIVSSSGKSAATAATAQEKGTAASQAKSATDSGVNGKTAGGLPVSGMTSKQAQTFVDDYWNNEEDSLKYIGGAYTTSPGGKLSNCVGFTNYFINKYTTLTGFEANSGLSSGHGNQIADNIVARNSNVKLSNTPSLYSVFSYEYKEYGHTGVVLAINETEGYATVGQATYYPPYGVSTENIPLSTLTNGTYKFAEIPSSALK
ncbi:MAG: hypothetical protein LBL41_01715 [Bifidobacteriaceae bacterium]|nr:hypothetical protein [Bifidobacteriaceae bacterium]